MQPSRNKSPQSPLQKVKNILVRYNCSKEVRKDSSFLSPEKFHLLKYSPKYYHTLSLEVTNSHPLQSKIKKIKKLKNFKGYFKEVLPRKLWLNLLVNTRKEIEEIPQTTVIQSRRRPGKAFWARQTLLKVKFFPNITSLSVPWRKIDYVIQDYDDALLIKKAFMRYLRNLRKVKALDMFPGQAHYDEERWMREKLNGMSQFLSRLEKLTMKTFSQSVDVQGLLKDQNLVSHLTGLNFSLALIRFDQNLLMIPQVCKNLRFLSIGFKCDVNNNPESLKFLGSIQSLPHLQGLEFGLPRNMRYYWSYFKPPSSLRSLKLRFAVPDLFDAGFFETGFKDLNLYKDFLLGHWDDIKELDELEFSVACGDIEDLIFLKLFITLVLKKVCKLNSFRCALYSGSKTSGFSLTGKPFVVEQIPHLYESLQKFEYTLQSSSYERYLEFDMKKMKAFRNLKELVLEGNGLYSENIEEIVDVLQTSEKRGDFPTLQLHLGSISSPSWFRDLLKKISQTKRSDSKLNIVIDLKFVIDNMVGNELRFLDEFCNAIGSAGFIKGLFIGLRFFARDNIDPISIEDLQGVMGKYGEIRNLVVEMGYVQKGLQFRKVDGEKEQFFVDDYEML